MSLGGREAAERDGLFLEFRAGGWALALLVVLATVAVWADRAGVAVILAIVAVLAAWADLTVGRNNMEDRISARLDALQRSADRAGPPR